MIYPNIENITPEILKKLIDDSSSRHKEMKSLYERYKGTKDGVPILTRKYVIDGIEQKGKVNNKLANDFFSEIVDMKVGFFCGVPIAYTFDKEEYSEEQGTEITDKIQEFNKINSISDTDSETAKRVTICGLSGRLFYFDSDNEDETVEVKIKQIDPWELIFLGDCVDDPEQTIRVYCTLDAQGEDVKHADIYDDTTIRY